ncbi:MAG: serine/threonine-protein kinase [Myxococcota bacterium]
MRGRYRLDRVLGEGGFGTVFDGVDLETSQPVAVKVLHAHLMGHREIATRFRREALAVTQIGHPNIVQVLDAGEDADAHFIVMERLNGRDAAHALAEDGPFSIARAVTILRQICDALAAAHQRGVVHRDLKLDNVFLLADDRVKLLDFGVSKFLDAVDTASLMTRTGTTIGTPFYMSPEQAQGKKSVDHRADIYALGVILFKLLTGQHPFEDESYPMLVLKICTEPPPPLTRYRGDVSPALEAVYERALAKDKEDRFESASDFSAALAPFAAHEGAPTLLDAPRTIQSKATALSTGPTELSVDRVTGEPVSSALDEAATAAEASVQKGRGLWLGLAALLLLGGGAFWWMSQEEAPTPEPPQEAALPRPGPPVVQPWTVPEGTELGWRWLNPLPRAMPTWNDVEAGGAGLVAMVGDKGRAARLVGTSLQNWPSGTEADLHAVDWIGPAQAIAVGSEGAIQLLLMTGPRALASGVDTELRDVAALGLTSAIAVGDDGMLLRVDALQPSVLSSGREENFYGVHAQESVAWVVGQRGIVLRVEGENVHVERESAPSAASLRSIGGCDGAIYAVGDDRTVLRREQNGTWVDVRVSAREDWTDVACDAGRVVASGNHGSVLLLSGSRSVRIEGVDRGFRGVGSADGARTWLVGEGGLLAQLRDNHLVILTAGPSGTLFDVNTLGGSLVAAGRWGTVLRYDGSRFTTVESPTDAAISALTLLEEDRLLGVGDHGTLLEITWDAVQPVEGPEEYSWRDVVSADGLILAVGTDGALLRGTPGALVATRAVEDRGLWTVSGTPADAVIGGDEGIVLRATQTAARVVAGCGETTHRGSWRDADGVTWLVGDGPIQRLEGERCTPEERPGEGALYAIGIGPRGRPFAVGAGGAAVERNEEGAWEAVDLDTEFELRTVYATERDIYIAGVGGVVLRHPRL